MTALVTAGSGLAQSPDGPQEQPPVGFPGQQFVDSRGCVFLRAGYGGQSVWVQRLDSNRAPICGYAPTVFAQEAQAQPAPIPAEAPQAGSAQLTVAAEVQAPVIAPDPSPVPAAPLVVAPVVTKPAKPAKAARPATKRAPRAAVPQAQPYTPPRKIGCFRSAPVPQVVTTQDGRAVVVCTPGTGVLTGWRSPIYPDGAGPAPLAVTPASPPKGYVRAWRDDRLNPNRAQGTAEGRAQQEAVWTNQVPSRAITPTATASTPRVATQQAAAYVQIGVFAMSGNATETIERLSAVGLPAREALMDRNGQTLRSVYAGPFPTRAEASAALAQVRAAGFADAFIR